MCVIFIIWLFEIVQIYSNSHCLLQNKEKTLCWTKINQSKDSNTLLVPEYKTTCVLTCFLDLHKLWDNMLDYERLNTMDTLS